VFVGTLTEKLLTYALGRGLAYYDMPTVRQIVRATAREEYRFSALVMAVVSSTPFQMRINSSPPTLEPNPRVSAAARQGAQ
jgi:hypothetical protein